MKLGIWAEKNAMNLMAKENFQQIKNSKYYKVLT